MEKPIVIERYSDNGEHSHWELINIEDHSVLWSEDTATLHSKLEKARELLKHLQKELTYEAKFNEISGHGKTWAAEITALTTFLNEGKK